MEIVSGLLFQGTDCTIFSEKSDNFKGFLCVQKVINKTLEKALYSM